MASPIDAAIIQFDKALRTCSGSIGITRRASPANRAGKSNLTTAERETSARLMRVNHCGEVCAQALYNGQALTARTNRVSGSMKKAAEEETDHLSWCETRIKDLGSRVSYLNPLWYSSSFLTGAIAGLLGDRINLGFVAATEEGVCKHLDDHLQKLPEADDESRAILTAMKEDEARHQKSAIDLGGAQFPAPLKAIMRGVSNLMTRSTYWI